MELLSSYRYRFPLLLNYFQFSVKLLSVCDKKGVGEQAASAAARSRDTPFAFRIRVWVAFDPAAGKPGDSLVLWWLCEQVVSPFSGVEPVDDVPLWWDNAWEKAWYLTFRMVLLS